MADHFTVGSTVEKVILFREKKDTLFLIDKSVGTIKEGQVLALNETTGKLVKYDPASADAKDAFTVYTGNGLEEASTEDFKDTVASFGTIVDSSKVIGIEATDYTGLHKLYLAGIFLEEVNG